MSKRYIYQYDEYDCEKSIYDSKEDFTYTELSIDAITDLLNQQDQRIAELEEQLKQKDLAVDKFSKIDIWLMRKYGEKLYKDFHILVENNDIDNFIKISEVFDKIYEEMNKEMPLMWFNYGFFSNSKSNKGE